MTLHDERDRRFAQAEAALAEYFARVEAGEAIDFDEWSAQHAEIAGELEQLHALCQPLRRSGATPREDPAASAAHEAAARLASQIRGVKGVSNRIRIEAGEPVAAVPATMIEHGAGWTPIF